MVHDLDSMSADLPYPNIGMPSTLTHVNYMPDPPIWHLLKVTATGERQDAQDRGSVKHDQLQSLQLAGRMSQFANA